jgi:AcrR family transcriptional regulator
MSTGGSTGGTEPSTPARGRPGPRPAAERDEVTAVVRRRILRQESLDVTAVADEIGLGRTTIYRWFGDRDALLGEALWSLTRDTLASAYDRAPGRGAKRLMTTVEDFNRRVTSFEPFLRLLREDPQGTVRVLMSPRGGVQDRLIAALTELIEHERRTGSYKPALDPTSLSYVIVQIGMSYMFGTALVDLPPDTEQAIAVSRRLLAVEVP